MLRRNAERFADIPQLRASVLLKVYPRSGGSRTFAALAVLLRRLPGGAAAAADAVSCGTAPLPAAAARDLPADIRGVLRDLGAPPSVTPASPWPAALNPAVTVPAADLFHWRDDPATGRPVPITGAPPAAADLRICLWSVVWLVKAHDPF